jgi:hypothetical protein
MKIDITTKIGSGSDPAPTIVHYTRARFERGKVVLSGEAFCQGKSWDVEHTYYIPRGTKGKNKEEILEELFQDLL